MRESRVPLREGETESDARAFASRLFLRSTTIVVRVARWRRAGARTDGTADATRRRASI